MKQKLSQKGPVCLDLYVPWNINQDSIGFVGDLFDHLDISYERAMAISEDFYDGFFADEIIPYTELDKEVHDLLANRLDVGNSDISIDYIAEVFKIAEYNIERRKQNEKEQKMSQVEELQSLLENDSLTDDEFGAHVMRLRKQSKQR